MPKCVRSRAVARAWVPWEGSGAWESPHYPPAAGGVSRRARGVDREPARLTIHEYGNMVFHMKTTVEIPDELFIAAKKRAAELRQPLRTLIERGLRAELARPGKAAAATRRTKLTWVTVDGGLPAGVDVGDRVAMHDWLARHR